MQIHPLLLSISLLVAVNHNPIGAVVVCIGMKDMQLIIAITVESMIPPASHIHIKRVLHTKTDEGLQEIIICHFFTTFYHIKAIVFQTHSTKNIYLLQFLDSGCNTCPSFITQCCVNAIPPRCVACSKILWFGIG